MESIFGLVLEQALECCCAHHALKNQTVKLCKQAYNAALSISSAPLTQDLLAFLGQLLARHGLLL